LSEASVLDAVLERGVIRIPVVWWDPPEMGDPPEFYIDPATGRPTGVVPELAAVLATDLDVRLELVEIPWHLHMERLLDKSVDMLMSYTNTPRRALVIDFAGRLLPDEASALVHASGGISTKLELDQQGRRVAIPRGSSVIDFVRRHFPSATVVESDDPIADVEALRADALVECAITKPMLAKHPILRPLLDPGGRPMSLGMEYGHPAIRRGDPRFLNWLNNWLVYHEAVGTIDRWVGDYWTRWMIGSSTADAK
jgi:polar amino acid transport system substrate-binding protein